MRWLAFHYGWFGLSRERRSETPRSFGVRQFIAALLRARTLALIIAVASQFSSQAVGSRIKDLVMVAGARDNQLNGWGLVVGLAGDGDKDPVYTVQAIANALQRYGINVPASTLSSKNVSAVFVTADIKPFMKLGNRLDVTVSAMGDAKSLNGGVLLQTPLLGADGKVYAVAQGP
ncbi:MAG TPA: flagellar basal body P-ring protein FlgI, partial [Verrucomicrobiae bacterium]